MTAKRCFQAGLDKQGGFSLFEMVVVVLVIGVLVSMAIDRLIQLQIEAEKVTIQHVIGTLDSAVYVQTAEMVLREGLASMRKLENTNPMDYLARQPQNYLGERSGNTVAQVPDASWYFDPDEAVLVYRVRNKKYFESDIEGDARIRLRLSLVYRGDKTSRRSSDIQGVRLETLNAYHWKALEE